MPLLLEHLVEARLLVRVQQGSKLIFRLLQFFADLRTDRFKKLFCAVLAGTDDFVSLLFLVAAEVQLAFGTAQKFDSDQGRNHSHYGMPAISNARAGSRCWGLRDQGHVSNE